MIIKKILLENYKVFKGRFELDLNSGLNIIVGNNESGKSTILEAIHLALSGLLNGRYLRNELSQYLFNKAIEAEYIDSLKTENPLAPPSILIEIYFEGDELPDFEGDDNTTRKKACGIYCKIEFDSQYQDLYEELIKTDVTTIPIEFYKIEWKSFAREIVGIRRIPIKSVLIDSSSSRFQNGSDVYISKIIKDDLLEKEIVDISQAYRKLKEGFMADDSIKTINKKITGKADISTKAISISVDLSAKNSWETSLMTYLEGIPFHQIGKGEQCLIKTNLALAHKKTTESNLILIEEPENHLSHAMLNEFIDSIEKKCENKQIIITTHSSFVANKLNLNNLILLSNNQQKATLSDLSEETNKFFQKLPGYETLRLLLCKKSILVEGPSDELIIQRAYMNTKEGKLPINDGIEVISVGLTFKRFLEIAKLLRKDIAVVTDNDGDYEKNITNKYEDFYELDTIQVFADNRNTLSTLEPQIVDANKDNLEHLCNVLGIESESYTSVESISKYMLNNKTDSALQFFSSEEQINFPEYINQAVGWCDEQ